MLNSFFKSLAKFILKFAFWILLVFVLFYLALPFGIKKYAQQQDVEIQEVNLGLTRTVIKGIKFAYGEIKTLEVEYSLNQLFNKHLRSLNIDGADLIIEPQAGSRSEAFDLSKLGVQIDRITASNVKGEISGLAYEAYQPPPLVFTATIKGRMTAESQDADVDILFQPHAYFMEAHLSAKLQQEQLSAHLQIKNIKLPESSAVFNLSLSGNRLEKNKFKLTGKLDENQNELLTLEGTTNLNDTLDLKLTMQSLNIDSIKNPISHYWADAPAELSNFSGDLSLLSHIAWTNNKLTQNHEIVLKQGSFLFAKLLATGINTQLSLSELSPLTATPANVNISSVSTPFGEFTDTVFNLNVSKDIINISDLRSNALEGTLHLKKIQAFPTPNKQLLELSLNQISLEKLVANLNIEGLKIIGKISGQLPVYLYQDLSVAIDKASINTDSSGHLSYNWKTAEHSENSNLQLTAKAIKDLQYDSIVVDIYKPHNKNLSLIVFLKGHNPNVLKGRQFDIKIDLSGDIVQTIQASWDAYQGEQGFWQKNAKKR